MYLHKYGVTYMTFPRLSAVACRGLRYHTKSVVAEMSLVQILWTHEPTRNCVYPLFHYVYDGLTVGS